MLVLFSVSICVVEGLSEDIWLWLFLSVLSGDILFLYILNSLILLVGFCSKIDLFVIDFFAFYEWGVGVGGSLLWAGPILYGGLPVRYEVIDVWYEGVFGEGVCDGAGVPGGNGLGFGVAFSWQHE